MIAFPAAWQSFLAYELQQDYAKELFRELDKLYNVKTIFPPKEKLFTAFELVSPQDVKVLILGQDPYHGAGQANGLAFSVEKGVKIPPSLRNIYKELESDLGIIPSFHGDLTQWAAQGVLLLNATLTVEEKKAGSHHYLEWHRFTDALIKKLSEKSEPIVFILWGNFAQAKEKLIDKQKHFILKAPHPSPLSAYHGFFGSKVFSKTNEYLKSRGEQAINWNLNLY